MESGFLYYFKSPEQMQLSSAIVVGIVPKQRGWGGPAGPGLACRVAHACGALAGAASLLLLLLVPASRHHLPPLCQPPTPPVLPSRCWPSRQVTINLRDCVVEDFDAASQPSQKRSTQKLDSRTGGTVSLLIRVSHKVGRGGGWGRAGLRRGRSHTAGRQLHG